MQRSKLNRRSLLLATCAAMLSGCVGRVAQRPTQPSGPLPPDFSRWDQEARGILSDGLETLRTFETFTAFRVSAAAQSDRRSPTELAWDPPSRGAWEEATHVAQGLGGRAEQLFLTVTKAQIDPSLWREQRTAGEAANTLRDLGEALQAYRVMVDRLGPGSDGTDAWPLLDRAWERWTASAARWGLSRSEQIACGSS